MRQRQMACATLLAAMLTLIGCAKQMVYLLPDGRVPASDPVLSRQLAGDIAMCNDERARSVQGGDHGDGSLTRGAEVNQVGDACMADKGYVLVRQDQMAAKQQELAAATARARSDAAAPPGRN
jgi:hypothetical protein